MIRRLALQVAVLLVGCTDLSGADSLPELRQEFQAARTDGISHAEFTNLSRRALALAERSGDRGKFWSVVGLIADLCESGPYEAVADVRNRALRLLAQRFTDTRRWSSLLSNRFAPNLEKIPLEAWRDQLESFDRAVDALCECGDNDRVKAELLHARIMIRVRINRHWDWLTETDRSAALELLRVLVDRYGALPLTGSRPGEAETVAARAAIHDYELRRLHFGASAPRTAGQDLRGKQLDILDYRNDIIVLDFWTSFCAPCLAMVPDTQRLLEKYRDQPVTYIGVNGDSERTQGLSTAERLNMSWRNLWDGQQNGPSGPIAEAWRVTGWPSLFVIDGQGRIRSKFFGEDDVIGRLDAALQTLLVDRNAHRDSE